MKHLALIVFALSINFAVAQNKNCDCVVRIEPIELEISLRNLGLMVNSEIPKEYQQLLPLKKDIPAYHKIIKDSAAFWFIQPHPREPKDKSTTLKTKKLATTFLVTIQFNGKDSIPVYTEADEKSKIMRYIKRGKEKNNENDHWFAGCKPGFVKIKFIELNMPSGWINKEYYLHK